jgi:hypothetical protein
VASDFVMYTLDRFLLIIFNKKSHVHLFNTDAELPYLKNNNVQIYHVLHPWNDTLHPWIQHTNQSCENHVSYRFTNKTLHCAE